MEYDIDLDGLQSWVNFRRSIEKDLPSGGVNHLVAQLTELGVACPFFEGRSKVEVRSTNLREGLVSNGFSSRQRAMLRLLEDRRKQNLGRERKIHIHEAVTRFALLVKGQFPFVLASEFYPDLNTRKAAFPVPHVDICKSDIPSESLDLVVSQEVFEHVPSIDAALADIYRILKVGGELLATFPLHCNSQEGVRKAALDSSGAIVYFTEPEYHGNPVDPKAGSLVFEVPGWNILERAKKAGFRSAAFRFLASIDQGILASDTVGIFVFCAKK